MFSTIRDHIAGLRALDIGYKIFGAQSHRYISAKVSEAEIKDLETELALSLPQEYRRFLIEVGYGTGPYYGIWSPQQVLTEVQDLCDAFGAEHGDHAKPFDPFPITGQHLQLSEEKIRLGDDNPFPKRPWPCSGCIPVCYHGRSSWSVLVLRGEFLGSIWDVTSHIVSEGVLGTAARPPGVRPPGFWWDPDSPNTIALPRLPSPPTFFEWFSGWVQQCFADLLI